MPKSASELPHTDSYRLYTAQEYWTELCSQINTAKTGDKILLTSMTFEPAEPMVKKIVTALNGAVKRGVYVTFAVDAHSFMTHRGMLGPLWTHRTMSTNMPIIFRNKLEILQHLNAAKTGTAIILNKPSRRFSPYIAGRSHIKIAIINDRIYVGGCNLENVNAVDLMIGWRSKKPADHLYDIMQRIVRLENTGKALVRNHNHAIDHHTKLLIDKGEPGSSLILDEALRLIDSAQKWLVITCQFFPGGITGTHLLRAQRRGVKIEIIYAHPKHHGLMGGIGQQAHIFHEKTRLPRDLFKHALDKSDPFLHAKLIACDQGFMIGSHNYVKAGVLLGTAEIALLGFSESLAKAAVHKIRQGLNA